MNPAVAAAIDRTVREDRRHAPTGATLVGVGWSTVDTDRSHTHSDGNTYPYVALDVSSASHPVYTGQQRKTQSEGRIAGFNKRFATFGSGKKAEA